MKHRGQRAGREGRIPSPRTGRGQAAQAENSVGVVCVPAGPGRVRAPCTPHPAAPCSAAVLARVGSFQQPGQ